VIHRHNIDITLHGNCVERHPRIPSRHHKSDSGPRRHGDICSVGLGPPRIIVLTDISCHYSVDCIREFSSVGGGYAYKLYGCGNITETIWARGWYALESRTTRSPARAIDELIAGPNAEIIDTY